MSTKFFNNGLGHTLFDKLKGIASEMITFDRFLAVVGFFRSSGYFKLRKELGDVSEIKILVGINIDDIFRKHNKALLMLADSGMDNKSMLKCRNMFALGLVCWLFNRDLTIAENFLREKFAKKPAIAEACRNIRE